MDRATRTAMLEKEYHYLQGIIEKFDEKALQIKGWSVTTCLGGAATATIAGDEAPHALAIVYLLCCAGALCFWAIDATWKHFQKSYYARVIAIEQALRDGRPLTPLQITSSWPRDRLRLHVGSFVRCLGMTNVFLPHLAVAALCGLLAIHSLRSLPIEKKGEPSRHPAQVGIQTR